MSTSILFKVLSDFMDVISYVSVNIKLCVIICFRKYLFYSIMCLPLVSVSFHLSKPKIFISICDKIMLKLIVRKVKLLSLWSNCIILDSHSQGLAILSFPVCVLNLLLFMELRKDIAVFRIASLTEIFLVAFFFFSLV